jgi:hypothetical protein
MGLTALTDRDTSVRSKTGAQFYGLILLLPGGLLLLAGLANDGDVRLQQCIGAGIAALLGLAIYRATRRQPLRKPLAVMPATFALIWHWSTQPSFDNDPFPHFVQGALVLMAVGIFAVQTLSASGAPSLGQGRRLAARLLQRTRWPADLNECRRLPEVRELKRASVEEAAPVMPLLFDPRPEVQIAGLAALEGRRLWRMGQADMALKLAQSGRQPEIRCAALAALSHVQQRLFVEAMAEILRDPDPTVRKAAAEALFWDCRNRWYWMRAAVHDALADPRLVKDGPLAIPSGIFPPPVVVDLIAWATETGCLGVRATQSLSLHYSQQLSAKADPELLGQLQAHIANPKTAAVLRVELARLLQSHNQLSDDLLLHMIEPTNPSPLRLMAVEVLLQMGPSEKAVNVLREVARQPNRELALAASVIVQKHLHVDLGLAVGEPPPPIHSRQASEVTRRVIAWAKQSDSAPAAAQGQRMVNMS